MISASLKGVSEVITFLYKVWKTRITKMKVCNKCKTELPLSEFHKRTYSSGKIGHQNNCKKCQSAIRAGYYKPHEAMRRKFRLTESEYETLMSNDNCQICDRDISNEKKCIDHCHYKEKIRGVLCNNCNTALGLIGDNVSTLSRMIDYLSRQ